jgi:6-phosphogluconolactonase/glucosamine-6-phosphate isomerase/deaminase
MYEMLAASDLDWSRTDVFQVDERVAPPGHPDRNLTHLILALPMDKQPSLRPMGVTSDDLEAAAAEYAAGLPEHIDIVHLGIGPDGHTASLVPGDPVLDVDDRLVAVTGPYQDRRRMTLTYPALAAARKVFWLVTGESKRDALQRLLDGDRSIPAARVAAEDMMVVADEAAAGTSSGA